MPETRKNLTDTRVLRDMARYRNALAQDWSREMEHAADDIDAQAEEIAALQREVRNLKDFIRGTANNMLVMIEEPGRKPEKRPYHPQELRFHVDGLMFPDPDSDYASDGQHAPFYVFDVLEQNNAAGPFGTREAAQVEADNLNQVEHDLAKKG